MKVELNGSEQFEINIKRLYVPYTICDTCSQCGQEVRKNLNKDSYLSYLLTNTPIDMGMYCSECDHEWCVGIQLNLTVEATNDP